MAFQTWQPKHIFIHDLANSCTDLSFKHCQRVQSNLILAEEILLFKGEQNDVSEVRWVFHTSILGTILQHAGRLIDDPVWTINREDHFAVHVRHMHTHIQGQSLWVAGEADGEELRHVSANPHTRSPAATLVLDQNKFHYFTANIRIQHISRTALLKLIEVSRALWETWWGFNKCLLANIK